MRKPHYALDVSMAVRERPTGQARMICELLKSLDVSDRARDFVVVVRRGAAVSKLPPLKNIGIVTFGFGRELLWHQTFFPLYAVLHRLIPVSLSNTAPVWNVGIVAILDITYKTCASSYKSFRGRLSMLWHRFQYVWCARFARRVLTLSEFSKTEFSRVYGYPLDRIRLLFCGWEHLREFGEDEGVFTRFPKIRRGGYYFVLGNLFEFKNVALAVRTAVRHPETQWVITGASMKTSAYAAEPHENIVWTGYLSDAEVKALLKNAKALYFPSLSEGFGMPPLEALALGTPALVSRASCLPGVYRDTVHWIEDPTSENPQNPDELLKTPVAPPDALLAEYSWPKLGAKFIGALDFRKIGVVVPKPLATGGVGVCLRNYLAHLDHTRFQLDFFVNEIPPSETVREIEATGGHVFTIPGFGHLLQHIWTLYRTFRRERYDVAHVNCNTLSVFALFAAKLAGIPVRLAHAHSASHPRERLRHLAKLALRPFSKCFATRLLACSRFAGEFQFGRRTMTAGRVALLPNAIDLTRFAFNPAVREEIRKCYGWQGKFVIGDVGRLATQKNPLFMLEVFAEVLKRRPDAHLVFVGEGPLRPDVERRIAALGLQANVTLTGQLLDADRYYNAFDAFCLPSLYEGLGMVLVEAQANGLKCLASTEVPAEANVSGTVVFKPLAESVESWAEALSQLRRDTTDASQMSEAVRKSGYDIDASVATLESIYAGRCLSRSEIMV